MGKANGIVELVNALGNDKIVIQTLDQAAITLDWHHKKGTTITFATEMRTNSKGTEKMGLVLWLDREEVNQALDELKDHTQ